MTLLSKLGVELKSLFSIASLQPQAPSLQYLPGSHFDDHAAAGPLHENPAAAACFVALTKAFAQATPYLEKRAPNSNTWQREDHPLAQLLNTPNPYYSGEKLFGVTLICAMSQGAAFWRLERDQKGDPSELWYEPPVGLGPSGIAPNWDSHHFIKDYYHFIDGQRNPEPIPREDVIYFRHGLNVANPRLPWSPLGLGAREIATLNAASSYTSAVMRNHGMPSGFISLDASATSGNATPEQAESLKAHIEAKFGGPHNAGKTFVSSLPWKWNKTGLTPAEMVIDKIRQWPQETICALLGTPVIVALLPTGEQPTYQNLDASMRWWWDNTIIPLEDAFADEIETQLFPAFGLNQNDYRLSWDRSRIPALQEDEHAKHAMWREDYKAGCIDRYTYLTKIGEEADEKLRGVLHPSATSKDTEAIPSGSQKSEAQRRWSYEAKLIDANGMEHDARGRFGHGGWRAAYDKAVQRVDGALDRHGIVEPNRSKYAGAILAVFQRMTEANLQEFEHRVKSTVFYNSIKELQKSLEDEEVDPGKAKNAAAAWISRGGEGSFHLDGADGLDTDIVGLYAHEISHMLDNIKESPGKHISDQIEWHNAWDEEIRKPGRGTGRARVSPGEGFAEFGQILLGPHFNEEDVKVAFPRCYDVWQKHGLR